MEARKKDRTQGGASKVRDGEMKGDGMRRRSRGKGLSITAVRAPVPHGHVSMATCGPGLGCGESGSDGGDLCVFRLAHYVANEVKQPRGAFVLRGLPLSCQASVYL